MTAEELTEWLEEWWGMNIGGPYPTPDTVLERVNAGSMLVSDAGFVLGVLQLIRERTP